MHPNVSFRQRMLSKKSSCGSARRRGKSTCFRWPSLARHPFLRIRILMFPTYITFHGAPRSRCRRSSRRGSGWSALCSNLLITISARVHCSLSDTKCISYRTFAYIAFYASPRHVMNIRAVRDADCQTQRSTTPLLNLRPSCFDVQIPPVPYIMFGVLVDITVRLQDCELRRIIGA